MQVKNCSKCNQSKEITEFYKAPGYKDGHRGSCKKCHVEYHSSPSAREKARLYTARRTKERAEGIVLEKRAKAPNYYLANRERIKERAKQWKRDNPEKHSDSQKHMRQKRRARMKGDSFTTSQWREMREFYNNSCLRCGKSGGLTADHVLPVSRGGLNDILNIQPLCQSCNSIKGTKFIDYRN